MYKLKVLFWGILIGCFLALPAKADSDLDDLLDVSLEELGDIVTLASRREEPAFRTSAAIYVLSQEDIRESGATSIPEALRMVPGLHVARTDSRSWAITSRGFNDGFGNKLLVLIDGRTVYTPLFSGVYWDVQDTFIEDIEHIEVIRGPGATLWGANAVNGVINIVTKKATDTQSKVVNVAVGQEMEQLLESRVGGVTKNEIYYRTYAKYSKTDSTRNTVGGGHGGNDWIARRAGFRMDWDSDISSNYTVQGDIYNNNENLSLFLPDGTFVDDTFKASGGNLMAKWNFTHADEAKSFVQLYYDMASADYSLLAQDNHTFDIEYQYTKELDEKNIFVVGGGYRYITDKLRGSDLISYSPRTRGRGLYSAFFQNTYSAIPNKLNVTYGSKVEHNDFTGIEIQPNIRGTYIISEDKVLWGAISRAVRTPNRSEDDLSLVVAPGFVRWEGDRAFESEELLAYELGFRMKPLNNLILDITGFVNYYDNLRTNEVDFVTPPPSDTVLLLPFDNGADGEALGVEVSVEWDITEYWSLNAAYTFLTVSLHSEGSTDIFAEADEGSSAKNQFNVRSAYYFSNNVELSGNVYYVDNISRHGIEPYIKFDTRVAWEPYNGVELSLVGFNLLDDRHQEFAAPLHGAANDIERGYYFKMSLGF